MPAGTLTRCDARPNGGVTAWVRVTPSSGGRCGACVRLCATVSQRAKQGIPLACRLGKGAAIESRENEERGRLQERLRESTTRGDGLVQGKMRMNSERERERARKEGRQAGGSLEQVALWLRVREGRCAADGAHAREAEPRPDAVLVEAGWRGALVSAAARQGGGGRGDAHVQTLGEDDGELVDLEPGEADLRAYVGHQTLRRARSQTHSRRREPRRTAQSTHRTPTTLSLLLTLPLLVTLRRSHSTRATVSVSASSVADAPAGTAWPRTSERRRKSCRVRRVRQRTRQRAFASGNRR